MDDVEPVWTILIATIGRREARFTELLEQLMPQVLAHSGQVTVSALWNNGERPLAEVRQDLVQGANSRYVSFVDDDDQLPEYYVDEVVKRLDGVDYVGWQMQCYVDGVPLKPTYHSLRYGRWSDDQLGFYRDVSHLNPVLTSIAKCVDYRDGDPPEDVAWADRMRGRLVTEHYIDRVMYHYRSSGADSTWQPGSVEPGDYERPIVAWPLFAWHSASSR